MKKEIKALGFCLKISLLFCVLVLIIEGASLVSLKDVAVYSGYFTLFYFYWTFCVRDTKG